MKFELLISNGEDRRLLASILSEAGYPNYVREADTEYGWQIPNRILVVEIPDAKEASDE